MDLFLTKRFLSSRAKTEEKFSSGILGYHIGHWDFNRMLGDFVMGVISVLLGVWAAVLSWEANALAGWALLPKLVFALGAFLVGFTYLVSYLVFKWDLVLALKAVVAVPVTPAIA
jgi:hypothetical protein